MTYANGHGRNAMHLTKGSMDTSDTKSQDFRAAGVGAAEGDLDGVAGRRRRMER